VPHGCGKMVVVRCFNTVSRVMIGTVSGL